MMRKNWKEKLENLCHVWNITAPRNTAISSSSEGFLVPLWHKTSGTFVHPICFNQVKRVGRHRLGQLLRQAVLSNWLCCPHKLSTALLERHTTSNSIAIVDRSWIQVSIRLRTWASLVQQPPIWTSSRLHPASNPSWRWQPGRHWSNRKKIFTEQLLDQAHGHPTALHTQTCHIKTHPLTLH